MSILTTKPLLTPLSSISSILARIRRLCTGRRRSHTQRNLQLRRRFCRWAINVSHILTQNKLNLHPRASVFSPIGRARSVCLAMPCHASRSMIMMMVMMLMMTAVLCTLGRFGVYDDGDDTSLQKSPSVRPSSPAADTVWSALPVDNMTSRLRCRRNLSCDSNAL